MAYDARTESIRLIGSGLPDDPVRLSRRRRFAAVSCDVRGDAAATWFVRRGAGCFRHEIHLFTCRRGEWAYLGGGGHDDEVDGLADRPPAAELLGPLVRTGGGGVAAGRLRRVRYALVRVAQEVAVVDRGHGRAAAPRHGRLVVVWRGRPPLVEAWDGEGDLLGSLPAGAVR